MKLRGLVRPSGLWTWVKVLKLRRGSTAASFMDDVFGGLVLREAHSL